MSILGTTCWTFLMSTVQISYRWIHDYGRPWSSVPFPCLSQCPLGNDHNSRTGETVRSAVLGPRGQSSKAASHLLVSAHSYDSFSPSKGTMVFHLSDPISAKEASWAFQGGYMQAELTLKSKVPLWPVLGKGRVGIKKTMGSVH